MPQANFKILFALNAYLKQLGISDVKIEDFIEKNKLLAEKLVFLFEARFQPENPINKASSLTGEIEKISSEFKKIASIFENLILKFDNQTYNVGAEKYYSINELPEKYI